MLRRCSIDVIFTTIILCVLFSGTTPVGAKKPLTRATVLVTAHDVQSSKIAEYIEQIGIQRLARDAEFKLVVPQELMSQGQSFSEYKKPESVVLEVKTGISEYYNLELKKSIETLTRAVQRFEKMPALVLGDSAQSYIQAMIYLGAAFVLDGKNRKGRFPASMLSFLTNCHKQKNWHGTCIIRSKSITLISFLLKKAGFVPQSEPFSISAFCKSSCMVQVFFQWK